MASRNKHSFIVCINILKLIITIHSRRNYDYKIHIIELNGGRLKCMNIVLCKIISFLLCSLVFFRLNSNMSYILHKYADFIISILSNNYILIHLTSIFFRRSTGTRYIRQTHRLCNKAGKHEFIIYFPHTNI